jgi:hypothetical protein
MITEGQERVMIAVLKSLGYSPLPERDERGGYVYDMKTGDVLFHDDMENDITLFKAYRNWCKANGIIPF